MKTYLLLSAILCSTASAQIASENFELGNPQGWTINGNIPVDYVSTDGNPGGMIRMPDMGSYVQTTMTGLDYDIVIPTAQFHPWAGDFRSTDSDLFRFDFRMASGTSVTGAELIFILGDNNGTPDFIDDTYILATPAYNPINQFWQTVDVTFDVQSTTLPDQWSVISQPLSPLLSLTPDQAWNAIVQSVDYVGIAVNPTSPFSVVDLELDNLFLLSSNDLLFTPFCDPAALNSTGLPTTLVGNFGTGVGSDLHLSVSNAPPQQYGYFLIGVSPFPNGIPISDGNLCLIGSAISSVGRYNHQGTNRNSIGVISSLGFHQNLAGTSISGIGFDVPSELPMLPGGTIGVGQTWHFQYWHRDSAAGAGHSNFSNGLSVQF